jgi:hypothetical protein
MPSHEKKKKMGLGQALLLPDNQPAIDSTPKRTNDHQHRPQIVGTSNPRQAQQAQQPNLRQDQPTALQRMTALTNEKKAQARGDTMRNVNEQQHQQTSAANKSPLGQSIFQKSNQDILDRRDSVQLANDQQQQDTDMPEPHSVHVSPSVESEKDSVYEFAHETMPKAENERNTDSASFDLAPPLTHPLLSSKHAENLFQTPKPRVSFSDPLTIGPAQGLSASDSIANGAASKHQVDDLASPSLPAFDPRTQTSKPPLASSKSPTAQPPTKPSDPVKPAVHPVPRKRPASQTDPTTPVPANPSSTTSPSTAKRLKSEEMQQRKARLEAELKAKRERKAAIKKANDEEELNRQQQQRLWAEEDARRREEEARRREAEEEAKRRAAEEDEARKAEEAFLAEMEALERENEMEDEDLESEIEKGARQRMEWEELMRARGDA